LVGVGAPKFAQKTPQEINQLFYTRVLQGMTIGLACFLGYFFLSPYLFYYLLPQYIESLPYSQLAALALVFAVPNRYVSLLLVSQKLSKTILWNSVAQNLLRIVLYVGLGIAGGIFGLVLALVLMSLLGMLVNIAMWRHASRTS